MASLTITVPLSARLRQAASAPWTLGLIEALAFAAGGYAVGYAAWLSVDLTVLLVFLPLIAGFARRRVSVLVLMLGYFAAGDIELPTMIGRFFADASWFTLAAPPIALTAVLAAPFLIYAPRATWWIKSGSWLAALVVLTLPPVGLLAWRNPLYFAGELFPHLGAGSLAFAALLSAALAGIRAPGPKWARLAPVLVLGAIAGGAVMHFGYRVNEATTLDWAALDTHQRPASVPHAQTARTQYVVNAINEVSALPWVKAIILPESAIQPYRPVDELMLFEPSNTALRRGQALLFGAVVRTGTDTWRDVVMAAGTMAGPDGAPRIVDEARVPMPMGNWHLGLNSGAPLRAFATDAGEIAGVPVAWSICYEDMILWPHRFLLTGGAKALVSVDNDWVATGTRASRTQAISAMLLARMAGVPRVSARNQ